MSTIIKVADLIINVDDLSFVAPGDKNREVVFIFRSDPRLRPTIPVNSAAEGKKLMDEIFDKIQTAQSIQRVRDGHYVIGETELSS